MYLFYEEYARLMNAPSSRSMSFSHETSAASVEEAHCYGAAIGASLAAVLKSTGRINTTGASSTCTGYPNTCSARPSPSPHPHPPAPGPSPTPHHAAYTVLGSGCADCNGVYKNVKAPAGWEHSPYYQKDKLHSLYRYTDSGSGQEVWHICHEGVKCYYDAPPSSYGASEPPTAGWLVSPGGIGRLPTPTLSPID